MRDIVEIHGDRRRGEDVWGKGATFVLRLPFMIVTPVGQEPREPQEDRSDSGFESPNLKILANWFLVSTLIRRRSSGDGPQSIPVPSLPLYSGRV